MAERDYEYTAVKLPFSISNKRSEESHTEMLNRVSAHGSRLVGMAAQQVDVMAYFERPASQQ